MHPLLALSEAIKYLYRRISGSALNSDGNPRTQKRKKTAD
jgi:hypothetical protein